MSEPFIGEIKMVGFNFAPRGWALCDGQLLPISQNTALFSLLGTTYGGDGRTTFGLPDLRGRVPTHQGTGPGLTNRRIGEKIGTEYVTLNVAQMPSHNHAATGALAANSDGASTTAAVGNVLAEADENTYTSEAANENMQSGTVSVTVSNAGGGQPHNNMQPTLCINFVIALVGLFPSRN